MAYSNMELFATRLNRILTNVGGMPIKFNVGNLNLILGTKNKGEKIYTTRKESDFNHSFHTHTVRNICRYSDLSDDFCHLPFRLQLLPLQVQLLHSILLQLYVGLQ